ncbi:NAD(P)/FAD-dependent oxidoreductase [Haloferax mediterranei ATCC 33500]|uniref:NAD(P)/FAD-dependent oxidoreductase n=1 Tax=Haloferax mediterranei (strain ATCC 33500 / DSM 1411 / JCM 8866 / NBRC 14739 / NCIMB 2177 / R-4) TaxID=523841 RepID=I3R3G7_HALMT|nr:FAD-dependent oxidoreductase [Haloferax mediterranei]AFK18777.1 thioredoxin reductase [Haloferax mediterranei ATCC 33500]AHZ21854.1 thioredoxin reductase [Haloferax mediterranei ATCC 33500]EMA03363.1 thioredoxin reductase [Haloferax mediterranei ATCC 33500]MDX5988873.1 FAD-dependent oxidoreductase [Haloferax mediterranei ATCC 33500]QCQ75271.1 NAD(P)/FAD-dependent oxidoreductase [Haloferax mediterranei ATCC 33500]
MSEPNSWDALVVGGGVAGLTAATFLARAGLDTLVVNEGESIVRRNAHLENVPGFPAGVNSRLFTDLLTEQAERSGADRRTGRVIALDVLGDEDDPLFWATVETEDGEETIPTARVVAASWADASYLEGTGVERRDAGSKTYVEVDDLGRTAVPGLYAAGRLTEIYHQAVVAAGDAAETAITLVHDSGTPFYNDWVAPTGYFTDRGREVPPACEEIDADERERREAESRAVMQEFFAEPHEEPQRTHPSLVDDDLGRLDE